MLKKSKRQFFVTVPGRGFLALALIVLLALADGISVHTAEAQGPRWTMPRVMPGFDLTSWPPILIADQNRTVHAFSSQWVGVEGADSFRAIVYNRWTLAQGWTNPTDIILSPSKEARLTDAYLDSTGTFHVVFWGGDNTAANIYYSRAFSADLNKVQAWEPPVIVAEDAGDPEAAVFVEDDDGALLIIYHGKINGNGIYVIKSQDGGNTWSSPSQIFLTSPRAPLVWYIHVIKSSSGLLHAVWNVYNDSGQGRGIYYARSRDGLQWSDPILLATAQEGLGTMTPTIIEYRDSLFAIYNLPPKIRMKRSLDGGLTWSDLVTLFPRQVGVNGSLSAVIDGSDILHLFFGQRITGNPDIHGMWHSTWMNNRWSEPDAIIKGPQVNDPVGLKSFDPYEARAVVSQGNVLLVTWRQDPGLKGNGVWYSYKVLDIPELPVHPLPGQDLPAGTATPVPVATADDSNSAVGEMPDADQSVLMDQSSPSTERGFGSLLAAGAVPAILLILALVVVKIIRTRAL